LKWWIFLITVNKEAWREMMYDGCGVTKDATGRRWHVSQKREENSNPCA
jgi:hypothetical protein